MKIGIDISQVVYEGTGVASYVKNLVEKLIENDPKNEYVLFFSSLRRNIYSQANGSIFNFQKEPNVTIKAFKMPPKLLDLFWNTLHIFPIEWFIGNVDIFISSDWTQPPTKKARKATIIYDMIIYKHPKETAKEIINVQKRRYFWVKKEIDIVFCISEATKKDAIEILGLPESKLAVTYPGF